MLHLPTSRSALALAALLALAACGGNDDEAPAAAAAAPDLLLAGTAAVGAAIAGGSVSVSCAGGSATATTAASGAYSVTIAQGVAPCLVRVTGGGTTLYSMLPAGSAGTATVNVTPLTTLMTAQVLGADPASVTSFDTAAQARVTSAAIATARTDLTAALSGRVDISAFDPIATTFAVGDAVDQRLDQLADVLTAAGTDLAGLSATLVANPGSADPVRNLVAPAASSCAAFKSGEYWSVEPRTPLNSVDDVVPVSIDAATLSGVIDRGLPTQEAITFAPVTGEPCRFTAGTEDLAISSSGIGISRFPEGGGFNGSIFFPRTTLATGELAGSWNYVGYAQDGSAFVPTNGSLDIAADGTITNSRNYINLVDDTLPIDATPRRLEQRADGSYNDRDLGNNVLSRTRWLPHKAASGVVTIFVIGIDGGSTPGIAVLRRQRAVSAPAAGLVAPYWESLYTASGIAAISAQSVTVTSVNTSATPNTATRIRAGDNRVDTRSLNSPRNGLLYRALNACSTGVGGPVLACPEAVFLADQGTGFNVVSGGAATSGFFNVAVQRP